MSEVTLTTAVRQNLLSLQSTADLIGRTQNRLSTGLRVSNAIDDPVNFFQAKGLTDRASDFMEKKSGIDQGISTLTTATDAVTGVEALVQQLKGLSNSAKSSTTQTEIDNIITQFNDLRLQIGYLTTDATYQGLNLVNGTGSTLTVQFSNDTASLLTINSIDVTQKLDGMSIGRMSAINSSNKLILHQAGVSAGALDGGMTFTFTVAGQTAQTLLDTETFSVALGTHSFTVTANTSTSGNAGVTDGTGYLSAGTYSVGDTLVFTLDSGGTSGTGGTLMIGANSVSTDEYSQVRVIGIGTSIELNARIQALDSNLSTLRSNAQVLGSNIAVLNTRLDFTTDYVNTLSAGASKLTLADLNEEGANLLALQTRQQLGIQSLAFAGQSEQSILGLFR